MHLFGQSGPRRGLHGGRIPTRILDASRPADPAARDVIPRRIFLVVMPVTLDEVTGDRVDEIPLAGDDLPLAHLLVDQELVGVAAAEHDVVDRELRAAENIV